MPPKKQAPAKKQAAPAVEAAAIPTISQMVADLANHHIDNKIWNDGTKRIIHQVVTHSALTGQLDTELTGAALSDAILNSIASHD